MIYPASPSFLRLSCQTPVGALEALTGSRFSCRFTKFRGWEGEGVGKKWKVVRLKGLWWEKCSHSIAVRGHPGESWLVGAERWTNNPNFTKKGFYKQLLKYFLYSESICPYISLHACRLSTISAVIWIQLKCDNSSSVLNSPSSTGILAQRYASRLEPEIMFHVISGIPSA